MTLEKKLFEFAHPAADGKTHQVDHFSRDVIILIGYRVMSLRVAHFRSRATRTLRDLLLRGYTLNEHRLADRGLGEITQAVELFVRTLIAHARITDEGQVLRAVVQRNTGSWRLLLDYDEVRLGEAGS